MNSGKNNISLLVLVFVLTVSNNAVSQGFGGLGGGSGGGIASGLSAAIANGALSLAGIPIVSKQDPGGSTSEGGQQNSAPPR